MNRLFPTQFLFQVSIVFILTLVMNCKSRAELEIEKYLYSKDFLQLSIVCSKHQLPKYEKPCSKAIERSKEEIEGIISIKTRIPYSKVIVEQEKKEKIETLLKKNVLLDVQYRTIWKEAVN